MILKRKYNIHNPRPSCVEVGFSYCWVVIFSFLFVSKQFAAFASTHTEECEIREGHAILQCDDLSKDSHPLFHLPFDADSTPLDSEVPDEEPNDNFDDESGKACWNQSTEGSFDINSQRSLFLQLLRSIQNRHTVSLIILHHSWKSFLI